MRVEDPLGGLVMGDGAQENNCMNKDSNHSSKSSGNDSTIIDVWPSIKRFVWTTAFNLNNKSNFSPFYKL